MHVRLRYALTITYLLIPLLPLQNATKGARACAMKWNEIIFFKTGDGRCRLSLLFIKTCRVVFYPWCSHVLR